MIIAVVGNTLEIKSGASASPEYIALSSITNIFPLYQPAPNPPTVPFGSGYPDLYKYPTRTQITLTLDDRYSTPSFRFELQDITSGILAAYNTGTKANLDAAAAALAALIP